MNTQIKNNIINILTTSESFRDNIKDIFSKNSGNETRGKEVEHAIKKTLEENAYNVKDISDSRVNSCGEDLLVSTINGDFFISVKSSTGFQPSIIHKVGSQKLTDLNTIEYSMVDAIELHKNNFGKQEGLFIHIVYTLSSMMVNVKTYKEMQDIEMVSYVKVFTEMKVDKTEFTQCAFQMESFSDLLKSSGNEYLKKLGNVLLPLDI